MDVWQIGGGEGPAVIVAPVAVVWATPMLPMAIPLDALSAPQLATLAQQPAGVRAWPLHQRVERLLAVDAIPQAWQVIVNDGRPIAAPLDATAAVWIARERQRLQIPDGDRGPVVRGSTAVTAMQVAEVARGLEAAQAATRLLPWPRWSGPVVLCAADEVRGIPAGGLARPALPLLQLPVDHEGDLAAWAAAAQARLALALSAPPAAGWPAWVREGLAGVAAAKARGTVLTARRLREDRAAAGVQRVTDLVQRPAGAVLDRVDTALALAVAQAVLGDARQGAAVLDLMRGGASTPEALRIAARMTVDDLVLPP